VTRKKRQPGDGGTGPGSAWRMCTTGAGADYGDVVEIVRATVPQLPDVHLDLRCPTPTDVLLSQCWAGGLRDAALSSEDWLREAALAWVAAVVDRLNGAPVVSLLSLLLVVGEQLVEENASAR
jgi:hypothetical protein